MSHTGHHLHALLSQCGEGTIGFAAGLTAGFASSLHCLAMCGGIAAALSLRGGPAAGGGAAALASRAGFLAQAQGARVAVYIVFGALAGLIGAGLTPGEMPVSGLAVLRWLSAAVLVTMGLSLAGWAPVQGAGARLAAPVTKRLHHLHRFGAPGLGAVWGLMPCSMVWLMTVYAGLSGSPARGALIMAGFGLGTLPALMALGAGAGTFSTLARNRTLQLAAGLTLIALGATSLLL